MVVEPHQVGRGAHGQASQLGPAGSLGGRRGGESHGLADVEPHVVQQAAEHAVHGRDAAGERAVGEFRPVGAHVNLVLTERRDGAHGQARRGRAVGDRGDAFRAPGADGQGDRAGMHVHAVDDHFAGHLRGAEHGAGQARCPVRERRHAVEEVRRVPGAGIDTGPALFVGGAGMPERHAVAGGGQAGDEIQRVRQFRRQGDDAHRRRVRVDGGENRGAGERALVRERLAGQRRPAQAARRLRALVARGDEVALEMRAEHAGAGFAVECGGPADRREERRQHVGRTRHRRRQERGHTVARQQRRHAGHGLAARQHIDAADAVDVRVDEARHEPAARALDIRRRGGVVGRDLDDAPVRQGHGLPVAHALRRDEPRAAQADHRATPRRRAASRPRP